MIRALILLAWLVCLAVNAPGHLSFDSVVQLLEGRTGVYEGNHPPFMSVLLGRFDKVVPGTALYLVFASALFYLPLMALVGGRGPRRPLHLLAAGLLVLALVTPLLLIYQGIVWKDVLFANFALSTFACLACAERDGRTARRVALLAAAALFAAGAAATRQNGFVIPLAAALVVALRLPLPGRQRLAGVLLWALATGLAFAGTQAAVRATATQPVGTGAGLMVLQGYDIVGMIAHGAPLYDDARAGTPEAQALTATFRRVYEASRMDRVLGVPEVIAYLGETPLQERWMRMIRQHPGAWLAHRAEVFRWMVLPPDIRQCLPVWVGVEGPAAGMTALALPTSPRPQDGALYAYSTHWYGTPLFFNGAWAALAVALLAGLAWRRLREPGDAAMAGLLASALAFAASFALIGIACDVRYLFLLPVACCGTLAHLAAPARGRLTPAEGSATG